MRSMRSVVGSVRSAISCWSKGYPSYRTNMSDFGGDIIKCKSMMFALFFLVNKKNTICVHLFADMHIIQLLNSSLLSLNLNSFDRVFKVFDPAQ